ncbi:hypothetical protein GM708_16775, partial [Vibrio cholerae]|nr:hypothetical protein [Vibrio cholerae]
MSVVRVVLLRVVRSRTVVSVVRVVSPRVALRRAIVVELPTDVHARPRSSFRRDAVEPFRYQGRQPHRRQARPSWRSGEARRRSGGQDAGGRAKPAGAKAFGRERFGQNLGPVRAARPKRASRPADEIDVHNPEGVRLQKVMA